MEERKRGENGVDEQPLKGSAPWRESFYHHKQLWEWEREVPAFSSAKCVIIMGVARRTTT
jgi:hypothetical protein